VSFSLGNPTVGTLGTSLDALLIMDPSHSSLAIDQDLGKPANDMGWIVIDRAGL
jgi:hypothetical protein